jgi:hypothetical protein
VGNIFVDAALFLGMHSADEDLRIRSKNFFADHLNRHLTMSLEQVGLCDDVIWRHSRSEQDAYYPFMDCLHTHMQMHRPPVTSADVECASRDTALRRFDMPERLMLAKVILARGALHTLRPLLLAASGELPVLLPPSGPEQVFPGTLEAQYQTSLCLRLSHEELKI